VKSGPDVFADALVPRQGLGLAPHLSMSAKSESDPVPGFQRVVSRA
jgi:hypothetical protein